VVLDDGSFRNLVTHLALKVMPNDLHIYFIKIGATLCRVWHQYANQLK